MPVKAAYFLAIPGFADWEAAHALAELRRHGRYRVRVVGIERRPVTSMGGLTVHPDGSLVDVDFDDVAIMILPGGDRWEREPVEGEIAKALEECVARGIPIAAICAATTAVARLGLCRGRQHTSNGLAYLQRQVPTYADAATYIDVPAVRDRGLITACGFGDVEFAREIMAELEVLSEEERDRWQAMFRNGKLPETGI